MHIHDKPCIDTTMDVSQPLSGVISGVRGEVLLALVRLQQPVTTRRLAEIAGVSSGQAGAVVHDLDEIGLVTMRGAGRALLVTLNRQHVAADAVVELAGLRRKTFDRIRDHLATWDDLVAAWVFGSTARGDGGRDSDIDLAIIVRDRENPSLTDRIGGLAESVRVWTGNALQVIEHDTRSWEALKRELNPIVEEIRRDGVPVHVGSVEQLGRPAMSRPKGDRRPCGRDAAVSRLTDARQFLEAAEILEVPDVVATNAIASAVDLLRLVDRHLASVLGRHSIERPRQVMRAATSRRPRLRTVFDWRECSSRRPTRGLNRPADLYVASNEHRAGERGDRARAGDDGDVR